MRALVTGANGFIGASLVRALVEAGYAVRGMVRQTSDLRSLDGVPMDLVCGDVLDAASLATASDGCDLLFHAATPFAYWGHADAEFFRLAEDGVRNAVD